MIVDPRSPSGTEYAVPIDRARREAGTSTRKRSGSQGAPLFGEGVGDTPSNADRADGDSADGDSAGDRKARSQFPDRSREVERGRTRALRVQAAAGQDGWIGVGGIIAVGIGVLLVGGLIGLWLRRRATT